MFLSEIEGQGIDAFNDQRKERRTSANAEVSFCATLKRNGGGEKGQTF